MNNRPQKQSMAELKLRRVTEHIQRLRDDLARPRVRVSEAAQSLIRYTRTTKDPLVCFFSLLVQCPCGLLIRKEQMSDWSASASASQGGCANITVMRLMTKLCHPP